MNVVATEWRPSGEAVVLPKQPDALDAKPLVVWGGIPGEKARVRLIFEGQNQVMARFVEPDGEPSPGRRPPPCNRYDLCGGCPWMHLKAADQRTARLKRIEMAFSEEGLDTPPPTDIVPSPDGGEGYRHMVKLVVAKTEQGHTRLGTYARGSHEVVTIPGCNVLAPELRRAMKAVAHHIIDLDIFPYEPDNVMPGRDGEPPLGRGVLRYVVMRQSRASKKILVTLVVARRSKILPILGERLLEKVEGVEGVAVHVNTSDGNAIFDYHEEEDGRDTIRLGVRHLAGSKMIEDEIDGVRLRIGAGDFFQTNPAIATKMAQQISTWLEPFRSSPLLDLYSGVGGFTLALGRHHGWTMGVDVVAGGIERARENARINKVTAEFAAGRVIDWLPDLARRTKGQAPVVVVDPARRGLEPGMVEGILTLDPIRVVYISCNPRTLARDLVGFLEEGWSVEHNVAFDMFPQTVHAEVVVVLRPASDPERLRRAPRRRIAR